MAIPPTAKVFDQALDPYEVIDYLVRCASGDSPLLEAGESISTYTLSPSPDAAALGLTIGISAYQPSIIGGNQIKMWLSVDSAFHANAAFSGEGVSLPIEVTVVSNNTPPRTRQRTVVVKVAQQ